MFFLLPIITVKLNAMPAKKIPKIKDMPDVRPKVLFRPTFFVSALAFESLFKLLVVAFMGVLADSESLILAVLLLIWFGLKFEFIINNFKIMKVVYLIIKKAENI